MQSASVSKARDPLKPLFFLVILRETDIIATEILDRNFSRKCLLSRLRDANLMYEARLDSLFHSFHSRLPSFLICMENEKSRSLTEKRVHLLSVCPHISITVSNFLFLPYV